MYIEPFVPYDHSRLWELHNLYYATQGVAAWKPGAIPSISTNSYALARQHARFLTTEYERALRSGSLTPTDQFYVLEIGAGLGLFAANLFTALQHDCGAMGAQLATVLRYILSDYEDRTVRESLLLPRLQPFASRIIPAVFDLRNGKLMALDGTPLSLPIRVAYANYICCVSPSKQFHYHHGRWHERYVQLQQTPKTYEETRAQIATRPNVLSALPVAEEWRTVDLTTTLAPADVAVLTNFVGKNNLSPFTFPYAFLNMLRQMPRIMSENGLVVVTDFGTAAGTVPPPHEPLTFYYGNTLNHPVAFGLLESLAQLEGWSARFTTGHVRSLHQSVFKMGTPLSPNQHQAFEECYEQCLDSELLNVCSTLGQESAKEGRHLQAARYFELCSRLDRFEINHFIMAAKAFAKAGWFAPAQTFANEALRLDPTSTEVQSLLATLNTPPARQ